VGVLPARHPASMYAIKYFQGSERIADHSGRDIRTGFTRDPQEKRQRADHLFRCLVVAIRPLLVEELAELFAIKFDQDRAPNFKEGWRPENSEEAVLSACSTLIAVIEDCSVLSLL
jgi:hypothetical protein